MRRMSAAQRGHAPRASDVGVARGLDAVAVPRQVRSGAGGVRHDAGERRASAARPRDRDRVAALLDGAARSTAGATTVTAARSELRLLRRVGRVDPAASTRTARPAASPRSSKRVAMGAAAVIAEVTASRLMGRGGAAFPTGRKWDAVRTRAGDAALPRLQRRRVRAGHVQGSRADGRGPVRDRRSDGDRGVRHRLRARASSTSAASTRSRPRACSTRSTPARGTGGVLARIVRHRDPPRRRRLHLRRGDRDLRVDRGTPRRAAQQAAVPGRTPDSSASPPSSTTSKRSPTCRTSCSTAAAAFAAIGTAQSTGTRLFCLSGNVAASRRLRSAVRHHAAGAHRYGRRRWAAGGRCGRCCWAAPPARSCGRTSSICGSRTKTPAPPAPRSAPAS